MNNYYTYAYLRKDKTPYYIGKGKEYRAFEKSGRKIKPPKDKSKIIFLKQNLTEEEAFKHEIYMIAVFGRKDLGTGILRNLSDGGEGPSGKIVSDFTKQKLREINLGKKWDKKTREKLSASRKGKKRKLHSKETKIKMSFLRKGVFIGQNNPMYGKIHKEDTLKLMSSKAKIRSNKKYSNYYEFISPYGETFIEFTTIADFCEKYNLRADCMRRVVLGQRKSHKGWTGRKIDGRKETD